MTTQTSMAEEAVSESLPKERAWDGGYLSFYQGFWCPSHRLSSTIAFQNQFQPEDSDLIQASFPKSGTTWLKALTFTIVNRTTIPLSESPLLSTHPHYLVPSLEQRVYCEGPSKYLEGVPRPRIFATHVPFHSLPDSIKTSKCKLYYICRNPLDQFISRWNFDKEFWYKTQYSISLEESLDSFLRGVCSYGPMWDHVLGYWKAAQEMPDKVLFLKYVDLKADTVSQIKKLAKFLGFPFTEEEEKEGVIEKVSRLCSFEHLKNLEVNMNKNNKTEYGRDFSSFFRRGKVGDWTNYLTPSMAERVNKLFQEKLEGFGLEFKML